MAVLERVMKVNDPALFDTVIGNMQTELAQQLPWLDHVFGRAERLVKRVEGIRRFTPNVYVGRDEYLTLLPDQGLGNYCYFVMDEPEQVEWAVGERSLLTTGFSLVLWFDMRTVEDKDERNTERIKADVLNVLNGGIWLRNGSYVLDNIYSRAENVFDGFTLDEVDNQFLMSPFAGFRIHGTITIRNACV